MSGKNAGAEILTSGSLSSDPAYNIIADTELGREYLRFDTFDMTYAETVAATSDGGAFYGWTMADSLINHDFISAAFGTDNDPSCSKIMSNSNDYECGFLSQWSYQQFGASYGQGWDYFTFLSLGGTEDKPFGITGITQSGQVQRFENWGGEGAADGFSTASGSPINFLLYRENAAHVGGFNENAVVNNIVISDVPAPFAFGTTMLFGLLGFQDYPRNNHRQCLFKYRPALLDAGFYCLNKMVRVAIRLL